MRRKSSTRSHTHNTHAITDEALLEAVWPQVAATAWESYIQFGRGVVAIAAESEALKLAYLTRAEMQLLDDWEDSSLAQVIQDYVPHEDVVVVVRREQDTVFCIHHALTPPEAYRQIHGTQLCHSA